MTNQPVPPSSVTSNGSNVEQHTRFITELTRPSDDQRSHDRTSIRRPVSVYLDDETQPHTAVLRDISVKGVGLLHEFPLMPGEIILRVPSGSIGNAFCARVKLLWCHETAPGVYISGGIVACVFIDDPQDPEALDPEALDPEA